MSTSKPPIPARTGDRPWVVWTATAAVVLGVTLSFWWWTRGVRPRDHWAEVARARTHLSQGRPDLAFEAVSQVRDEAPGAAEAMTIAAQAFLMMGNVPTGRRALERSLQLQPRQPQAAKMLAAIYLAGGEGGRGIDLLKQAAKLEPGDFRPWFAMGKVYHDMSRLSDAADAFAEALRRKPPQREVKECRLGRIRALLDDHRAEDAAPDVELARAAWPDDPETLALAARQARAVGRHDEAFELAQRSLERDPRNADALVVRARILHARGQSDRALPDLELACEVNPNDVAALQLLNQVQSRLGLKEQAEQTQVRFRKTRDRLVLMYDVTKLIADHPEDPEPRWRLGVAALDGHLDTLAFQCFQAALDLDPNYQPARQALAAMKAEGRIPRSDASASPFTRAGR